MTDFYVSLAVSVMIQVLRQQSEKNKFRRAILKVFREIALQFHDDTEFQDVARNMNARVQ